MNENEKVYTSLPGLVWRFEQRKILHLFLIVLVSSTKILKINQFLLLSLSLIQNKLRLSLLLSFDFESDFSFFSGSVPNSISPLLFSPNPSWSRCICRHWWWICVWIARVNSMMMMIQESESSFLANSHCFFVNLCGIEMDFEVMMIRWCWNSYELDVSRSNWWWFVAKLIFWDD